MSFYSYKNSGSTHCPCNLSGNEVFSGLNEKICIQVQRAVSYTHLTLPTNSRV